MHCLVFGLHAAQVPALHTLGQTLPVFCQAPVASQVWGWSALHRTDNGTQVPEQIPALHTLEQAVPVSCQSPAVLQVCG